MEINRQKKFLDRRNGHKNSQNIDDQVFCLKTSLHYIADTQEILHNYPPKGRLIVVDIYLDAARLGISLALFTDPGVSYHEALV